MSDLTEAETKDLKALNSLILRDDIQRIHNRLDYDRSLNEKGREMLRNQLTELQELKENERP